MLGQRTIIWIIGLPLLIAITWLGEPWFTLLVAIMAILGSLEFYRMTTHLKIQPITYFGTVWVLLLILSPHCPYAATTPFLITSAIVISLIWLLFRPKSEQAFSNWAWTMAGILYIGWMLSYWISLRNMDAGREWVLWGLLTIVANDTGAFLIGKALGKHPLAPSISPGKTWEGTIGGLLISVIVSLALGIALHLPLDYWQMVLLGCVISVFAQLGDLIESLFKRNASVKDSGKLLPGHGGILDRTDSIIFTGVIVYYCAVLTTL